MSESIDDLRTLLEQQQERIEALEQQQAALQKRYQATKEQNEQVLNLFDQFKTGSISRRGFLTSVSAVAGISWLAGSADAAPNWSNASGNSGTESKPLKNVYAQNGTFQSLSTGQAVIKRVDSAPAMDTSQTDIVSEGASVSTTDQVILSDGDEAVVWVVGDKDGGTKRFIDRLATTFGNQSNTELLAVNNPATRSYSMPDNSLQLSMGSGTYNVTTTAIRMEVQ